MFGFVFMKKILAKHKCFARGTLPAIVTHNGPTAMRNDKSVLPATLPTYLTNNARIATTSVAALISNANLS